MPSSACVIVHADAGVKLSDSDKDEIDGLIQELGKRGQGSRPLKSPLLFGNYNVAYTSVRQAPGQQGQRKSEGAEGLRER